MQVSSAAGKLQICPDDAIIQDESVIIGLRQPMGDGSILFFKFASLTVRD